MPLFSDRNAVIPLPDAPATQQLGRTLAGMARRRDVIALKGDLGAGKSELARGFIHACTGEAIPVPSPTFTLMQTYETSAFPIYHFDLYRLESADELDELGWEEALEEAVTLVEWPEIAVSRLPAAHLLDITLRHTPEDTRTAEVHAYGDWQPRLFQV